jgi:hypothetical protein
VQKAFAVRLGSIGNVQALHHRTRLEILASVAHMRWGVQSVASPFDKVRADLETSRCAIERAFGVLSVAFNSRAAVKKGAYAIRAFVASVAHDGTVDDLADDSGFAASSIFGDLYGCPTQLDEEVYPPPVIDGHLFCHIGSPFILFCDIPCPHTQTRGVPKRKECHTFSLRD